MLAAVCAASACSTASVASATAVARVAAASVACAAAVAGVAGVTATTAVEHTTASSTLAVALLSLALTVVLGTGDVAAHVARGQGCTLVAVGIVVAASACCTNAPATAWAILV